ncbi:MAG: DUF2946 family protein [Herminiimonas sp.]|nr:DUF2946 family protein [Herminiimonas sp.]
MDDIVKQAMAKWPDVPHCYGWLALDARGAWRMRDEQTQRLGQLGDKIAHVALLAFINRNYTHDEQGRWYFQNGPQRVYVDLEATPFIVHTDPAQGLVLHTREQLTDIDRIWLTSAGQLVLASGERVAQVDDRDVGQCMVHLVIDGMPASDEQIMAWIECKTEPAALMFEYAGSRIPVHHLDSEAIASEFGFVRKPQPDPA